MSLPLLSAPSPQMQLLFSENDSPLHEKTTNQEAMQFDFTPEDKSSITPPPDIKTTEEPMVVAMMADAALGTAESMEVEEVALKEASVAEEFEPSVIRKPIRKKGPQKAKAVKATPIHKPPVAKRPTGSHESSQHKRVKRTDSVALDQVSTSAAVVQDPPKLELHENRSTVDKETSKKASKNSTNKQKDETVKKELSVISTLRLDLLILINV